MRKTKAEKGITLVALIITIIVLLILAVVAINAVQDDGIINYAKNSRNEYEKAQTNESTLLGNYMNYIKENVPTAKIITFTITIQGSEAPITAYAEEGMTWKEWSDEEEYNTYQYTYSEETGFILTSDGKMSLRDGNNWDSYVGGNEKIVDKSTYHFVDAGETPRD